MKRFAFRLENLLQYRSRLEEKERTKFSLMRAELLSELNHKDALLARQKSALTELRLKKSGDYNAHEITWHYRFLDRLELEVQKSTERAAHLEKNLNAQKQIMIAASRDKQMIENLKKKRQKDYFIALDREDQKYIDEIVVTGFARRS